jgi:GNAT superfamily N-acetyltransferase
LKHDRNDLTIEIINENTQMHAKQLGRIVRMFVKKEYRRNGFASEIIRALETIAVERGYRKIILKTMHHWADAVGFYIRKGYSKGELNGESITMIKTL